MAALGLNLCEISEEINLSTQCKMLDSIIWHYTTNQILVDLSESVSTLCI